MIFLSERGEIEAIKLVLDFDQGEEAVGRTGYADVHGQEHSLRDSRERGQGIACGGIGAVHQMVVCTKRDRRESRLTEDAYAIP